MDDQQPAQQLQVDTIRVVQGRTGTTMPCVTLRDRRAGGQPLVRFVFQRHLESVLYGRSEGSSGPIWKLLNATGMGATALQVSKVSVTNELLTQPEFEQLMTLFKQHLPSDVVDPSSLGRIRVCTLLPLATASALARAFGRSGAATAFLTAFSQPVPESWQMLDQQAANEEAGEEDLALNDKLDDMNWEAEDVTFAQELTSMPTFQAVADDEQRMSTYILRPQLISSVLKSELNAYLAFRTATFAARRQGGAVQSISAEADRTHLLRFFGYLERTARIPEGEQLNMMLMLRADLGTLATQYGEWLQGTQNCRFTTIANYLNGLISITAYSYTELGVSDAVFNLEPNPLAQLINLRGQAEKASKQQNMFDKRVGGWIEWEDVQKARVAAIEKVGRVASSTPAAMRNALRDAAALSLLSLIPPEYAPRPMALNQTTSTLALAPFAHTRTPVPFNPVIAQSSGMHQETSLGSHVEEERRRRMDDVLVQSS